MITMCDIGDQLAWTCTCEDLSGVEQMHTVQVHSIVALWSDVLDHVAQTHRRVMLDLLLGESVAALTKQFFDNVNAFKLTFHPPMVVPDDGVLTDPR